MNPTTIWRYMSLAKYIELLRTKSLYFPKASLFSDETEGKWFAHTQLYSQRQQWRNSKDNARILEQLLERAGDNPDVILREALQLNASRDEELSKIVRSVLSDVAVVFPHKRREYLQMMIDAWSSHHQKHNENIAKWEAENRVIRECTYISCWNRAPSTSLAMWEMYGGGREAVVVRSTADKLAGVLPENQEMLDREGLEGTLADVQYIANLKNPDESVQDKIFDVVEKAPSIHVSQFTIKPSIYEFEQEIRAIVYPKREDIFKPLRDPHPDVNGFSLAVGHTEGRDAPAVSRFIDSVHLHPALDSGSMMFKVLQEVNRLFGEGEIAIVADRVEALGSDIYFKTDAIP